MNFKYSKRISNIRKEFQILENNDFQIFEIHFLIFEILFLIFKIHYLIFKIRTTFKYSKRISNIRKEFQILENNDFQIFEIHFLIFEILFLIFKIHYLIFKIRTTFKC